jgi:DNA-binding HxlR family transcriptional regulator
MRRGYGQYCPVAKAAEVLCGRWTPLILRELVFGARRFSDIRRGVPLMSSALLAQRLRELEAAGIIEHQPTSRGHAGEYRLTHAGSDLRPLVEELGNWGQRWVRSQFAAEDLDPGLLMWDMRRCVKAHKFPPRRTVVKFEYRGITSRKRTWWIVSDQDDVDLCLKDPGFDVDLLVTSDLRTMTAVLMGALPVRRAVAEGRIVLVGPAILKRCFPAWLGLSPFANVAEGRPAAASLFGADDR